MNLQSAIRQENIYLDKYLEAKAYREKVMAEVIERKEEQAMSHPLKKTEVAELCGVTADAVYRWDSDASTFAEWCAFLKEFQCGKYYNKFKQNYRDNLKL